MGVYALNLSMCALHADLFNSRHVAVALILHSILLYTLFMNIKQ